MSVFELLFIALGLSADAFAVSMCKGLAMPTLRPTSALACGLWFGGFQGLMPILGYLPGLRFQQQIAAFDHWIAFLLLAIIGINMIRSSYREESASIKQDMSIRTILLLAVATSIDALTVGMTFGVLNVNIIAAATLIASTTAILSSLGVIIGHRFGSHLQGKAEGCGGLILVLIGTKILLEHLAIISF